MKRRLSPATRRRLVEVCAGDVEDADVTAVPDVSLPSTDPR
jgi:hypothetical protein